MPQVGVLVTWREVAGSVPTMAMLDERIAPFRLSSVLLCFARLAALLKTWQNQLDLDLDRKFARQFLPTYYHRINVLYETGQRRVTFTRLNLLFVATQPCRLCTLAGRDLQSSQERQTIL